jgi:hypothetical protein
MGGASDTIVHLNRYLADRGLLFRRAGPGRFVDRIAKRLRDVALAYLPAAIAQTLFRQLRDAAAELEGRARFGGFDWHRTLAFSEEANTNPGIWINLAGREAEGCVAPEDYEAVRDRVIVALHEWKLPSGKPVVARALRREEIHRGPHGDRAPDIVVELALDAGYGLSLVPTPWSQGGGQGVGIPSLRRLTPSEHAGGRGRGMNGTHRNVGVFIASGPGAEDQTPPERLVDVAAWLARAMGLDWPSPESRPANPSDTRASIAYDDDEEEMVAERLRALGYLD